MILEDYLADQYNRDKQELVAIEQVLTDVAAMFAASIDPENDFWPYELRAGDKVTAAKPSQGTSAMILAASGKMLGACTLRDGSTSERLLDSPKALKCAFDKGLTALSNNLRKDGKVRSRTFRDNDPLTISHLTELARGLRWKPDGDRSIEALIKSFPKAIGKIDELMAKSPADENAFGKILGKGWCAKSGFVALRVLRAKADLGPLEDIKASPFKDFFESQLHDQLSFSAIPDSRFDPAELAFCLEGLLICAPEAVDRTLFKRVFAVLGAKQETSAYWRPNRPFRAVSTGQIMLPLSVEGANSLLHSVEIMDGNKLYDTFAAIAVPMFRRFWQWLRARKVEINVEINGRKKTCIGWHSEHVNEAGVIHLWDTSQVVEFLLAFRKLLQRHIARETLVLSGVKIDEPKTFESWEKIAGEFEPLTNEAISPRVFDHVSTDFVEPWSNRAPSKNHSMLLYGPPGTGKTTIASSIANALSFRLITVTVSDFLGAGGALVEARAKAIFQMLEAQSDCVILFDELDAFLLDRDSDHYRRQDTLFQFLTPGMLTKINDLRNAGRSIFIIATNYANRIDPAIKRPGRIDRQYLLLTPDLGKRKSIILEALRKRFTNEKADADERAILEAVGKHIKIEPADVNEMAKASVYLGYKEIVGAIDKRAASANDIIEALNKTPRSSSHIHYLSRLTQETSFPNDEFVAIVKMGLQAEKISNIITAINSLEGEARKAWVEAVRRSSKLKEELEQIEGAI